MKNLFSAVIVVLVMSSAVFAQHGRFCNCQACANRTAVNEKEKLTKLTPPSSVAAKSAGQVKIGGSAQTAKSNAAAAVFVDFDSATSGADHVYTTVERQLILDRMRADYSRFDFTFTDTAPTAGVFSTITINDGPSLGLADDIDFRNLNLGDNATVDVNLGATTSDQFVTLTANVASHELGHLAGLRHGDSFGPIGSGIDPNTVGAGAFLPAFPGLALANETSFHLLESDGTFIENTVDQFFSERSAIKLEFNESGTVIGEEIGAKNTFATAQVLSLGNLVVPNTIEFGARAGIGDFDVDAISVIASLDSIDESDLFSFQATAGDLFNFEVISNAPNRFINPVDPQITILDSAGNPVTYFGQPAFNDDEFETFDSIIVDLVLPNTDTYFVQVNAFSDNDLGDYELFFHRFNGVVATVPEPSTIAMALLALGVNAIRRRRSLSLAA